ncbi:PREDICTED: putative protein FAM71E2 [Elephantulus edwardii]|uniref:putative protein FAM71E2 n=1 Tax=Elephantulus edwardii TaxID=28737 RepID=UPI0003F0AFB0|nr:PREDICTED: putative protein FAM71E2 [Elephantulus edwardii]
MNRFWNITCLGAFTSPPQWVPILGELQKTLQKGEYLPLRPLPMLESNFIQVTHRGGPVFLHHSMNRLTMGVAATLPSLVLPDILLIAVPPEHKDPSSLVLTRMIPLDLVHLCVHDLAARRLKLRLATGRCYYLELDAPDYEVGFLFERWSRLVSLLQEPATCCRPRSPHTLLPMDLSPSAAITLASTWRLQNPPQTKRSVSLANMIFPYKLLFSQRRRKDKTVKRTFKSQIVGDSISQVLSRIEDSSNKQMPTEERVETPSQCISDDSPRSFSTMSSGQREHWDIDHLMDSMSTTFSSSSFSPHARSTALFHSTPYPSSSRQKVKARPQALQKASSIPKTSWKSLLAFGPSQKAPAAPALSRKATGVSATSQQAPGVAVPSKKILHTPAPSKKVLDTPAPSKKVLDAPAPSKKVLDEPAPSKKVLFVSASSKKVPIVPMAPSKSTTVLVPPQFSLTSVTSKMVSPDTVPAQSQKVPPVLVSSWKAAVAPPSPQKHPSVPSTKTPHVPVILSGAAPPTDRKRTSRPVPTPSQKTLTSPTPQQRASHSPTSLTKVPAVSSTLPGKSHRGDVVERRQPEAVRVAAQERNMLERRTQVQAVELPSGKTKKVSDEILVSKTREVTLGSLKGVAKAEDKVSRKKEKVAVDLPDFKSKEPEQLKRWVKTKELKLQGPGLEPRQPRTVEGQALVTLMFTANSQERPSGPAVVTLPSWLDMNPQEAPPSVSPRHSQVSWPERLPVIVQEHPESPSWMKEGVQRWTGWDPEAQANASPRSTRDTGPWSPIPLPATRWEDIPYSPYPTSPGKAESPTRATQQPRKPSQEPSPMPSLQPLAMTELVSDTIVPVALSIESVDHRDTQVEEMKEETASRQL